MLSISFLVQSHRDRQAMAEALAAQLGRGARVVLDPDPDGGRCAWRTYREALSRPLGRASHLAVIQDDAELTPGFLPAVRAAVAAQPDRLIALFVPGSPHWHRAAVLDACGAGRTWTTLSNFVFCPAVAVVWPARLIPEVLEFDRRQRECGAWPPLPDFGADDEIIGRFLQAWGEWALATVPSLVEHRDVVESLHRPMVARGGVDPGRVAACFAGDVGVDALALDWSLPPHP